MSPKESINISTLYLVLVVYNNNNNLGQIHLLSVFF